MGAHATTACSDHDGEGVRCRSCELHAPPDAARQPHGDDEIMLLKPRELLSRLAQRLRISIHALGGGWWLVWRPPNRSNCR